MKKLYAAFVLVTFALNVSGNQVDKELKAIVAEMQRHIPNQVATGVVVTAMALAGKNVMTQYKLEMTQAEFKADKNLAKNFTKSSINSMCTDPLWRRFINQGVVIHYKFFDMEARNLHNVVVNLDICRKNKL